MSFDEEILEAFVVEANEHIDHLEPDLLTLETAPQDKDTINRIFRAAHSLKGSAGFFGLQTLSGLAHQMENVMSLVREDKLPVTQPLIDTLLRSTDRLRNLIGDLENSNATDVSAELQALAALLPESQDKAHSRLPVPAPVALATLDPEPALLERAVRERKLLYRLRLNLLHDIQNKGRVLSTWIEELARIGEASQAHLDLTPLQQLQDAATAPLDLHVLFLTIMQPDLLQAVLDIPREQFEEVALPQQTPCESLPAPCEPQLPAASSAQAKVTIEKKSPRRKTDDTLRVSVNLLDELMNLAGEMVLGRNQILRLSSRIQSVSNDMALAASRKKLDPAQILALAEKSLAEANAIYTALKNISQVTTELQEKVMRTRLQAVGALFGKFPRIVRDLSNTLGKHIELHTSGEDVELDKSIVEGLSDPLTHLIRNCADHAIETPAERRACGKPTAGSIRLEASHVGGQVHIRISDDGRGICPRKIREKALAKQLISADEAERMNDVQAQNLVFLPGFSTATKVSDLSGRGVGMDVVKTNVEKLGGSVELESYPGHGTAFILRLPLTLAIIPAMCVGVCGRRFAVPQVNLVEIIQLEPHHAVEDIYGTTVLRHREQLLPLVNLADILRMPCVEGQLPPDAHARRGYIIVMKVEEKRYGLLIDTLYNSEEIVVKPLSVFLSRCPCYSGETITGEGKVILILDAAGIASRAGIRENYQQRTAALPTMDNARRLAETQSILLFRNQGEELFAMNLAMVDHIEEIAVKDIERVGKKEFLTYEGAPLRLVRLHDFMDCRRPDSEGETLHVIIPKLVTRRMGIVATTIEDAVERLITLDETSVNSRGVLGSCILDGRLVLFLDIYGLFEAAEPEHYQWMKTASILEGKRILLAEDTAFFRAVGRQYLREFHCHVDVATNGLEAWERLQDAHYDLLLTDIEMPGLNGFELSQKVRASKNHRNLPIVIVSALHTEPYRRHAAEIGVDAYEVKLDKERLRGTLERVFSSRQKQKKTPSLEAARP